MLCLKIDFFHPYLLKMVVDPSKEELLMRELEDVRMGLSRKEEHTKPITVYGLAMMVIMMLLMILMVMIVTMGFVEGHSGDDDFDH